MFIILRTMVSTLTLQLFSYKKPTYSISLDSPLMVSSVHASELSTVMNISEDQLYEDMLKIDEVVL